MDPVSNVYWSATGKTSWFLVFNHLNFTDLRKVSQTCRKLREWILDEIVRARFMKWEGLKEVEGESCLKTFGNRNVVIALDCSSSMRSSTEGWRSNVALKEVKAIIDKHKYLAASKGITLIPFATYCSVKVIKHLDEVEGQINEVMERIGRGNHWKYTFEGLCERMMESEYQKSIFYIISDFEGFDWTYQMWQHFYADMSEPPIFNLCQVGKSIDGSASLNRLLMENSTFADGQPSRKKIKGGQPLEIYVAHIPREDGSREAFEVSKTEENIIEVDWMEEGSEEYEPTEIIDDEEEVNDEPERYVFFSSSSED